MTGHDAARSRRNRRAKGNKLQAFQPLAIRRNYRQIDVRIGRRIAVTREMLRRRQAAVFFDAAHKLADIFRNLLRIFAKRARVDDRIAGIVVDVRNRCVNPLHADGARFQRRDFAHRVGVGRIAAGRERHGGGERRAIVQAHAGAAFEIRADQQRQLRFRLQLIVQHRGRVGLALLDAHRRDVRHVDEAAAVQIDDIVHDLRVRRGIGRRQLAVIRREEKLADFFIDAHFLERRFSPLRSFARASRRGSAVRAGVLRRKWCQELLRMYEP